MKKQQITRRKFLTDSAKVSIGTELTLNFPTIVPASVFGRNASSNRINVASIGCGRISTIHDMTEIARYAGARIIAVCDLDKNRADAGPQAVKNHYIGKNTSAYVLFEGSAHDMEWLQMNAGALTKSDQPIKIEIPKNEEYLYIVRKRILEVILNDSSYSLATGSVLVLFPGEKLSIQNKQEGSVYFMESNVLHGIKNIGTTPCTYFAIQFE